MRQYDDYNYNLENQEEPDHEAYEQKLYEEARDEALEIQHQERLDYIKALKEYHKESIEKTILIQEEENYYKISYNI